VARLMRGAMGLWLLWHDILRMVRGTAAFCQYLRTPEDIQLGLGLFSANTSTVELGRPSQYRMRIANVSRDTQTVKVSIEIYAMNTLQGSEEHCGYMTKTLTLQPRTSATLQVQYDWLAQACFVLNGTPSLPDEFWNKSVPPPQLRSMHALLLDPEGNCLDRLTIYQEVTG
jgi:hypothetical protein